MKLWYHCRECNTAFWTRKTTTWCPTCTTHGYVRLIRTEEENTQVEEYVFKYGEKYRPLIVDALKFLDDREATWGLDKPIDRGSYIEGLVEKVIL
jgi:uncharacterized Zn finger protein (UPF0148 family)